ncbi:hypothetical protein LZ30DRAFT_583258 [Colletotrichum cereale]|nr:hypothetical protein LZ30DRAFT_583258 [Colletotrichum cereale]
MSKEAILPTHGPVTKSPISRSSTSRTFMVCLITCVLILSLFNYESAFSTINKGVVICKSRIHGQKSPKPTNTPLQESSQASVLPFLDSESPSTLGKQYSFSLRRRNGGISEAGPASSADGRSGYNRREEDDGRSGYNKEDGRSGYNSVTDGRSGYNRREEEDGRSRYNKVEDGRSGYNSVEDGRSGYNRAI